MNESTVKTINFETALASAVKLPGVRIDRSDFLRRELNKYCTYDVVENAIQSTPQSAGVAPIIIDRIAKSCINYEAAKVTAISAVAGLPGGIALVGTIPADIIQYMGHLLRVMQKIIYLYGWESLLNDDNEIDDETKNILIVLFGAMFSVQSATKLLNKIIPNIAANVEKRLLATALTKTTVYPIIKNIAKAIGVRMTKEIFAKGVSKSIPLIGAVTSGTLTYAMFKPTTTKFRKYIKGLSIQNTTVDDIND